MYFRQLSGHAIIQAAQPVHFSEDMTLLNNSLNPGLELLVIWFLLRLTGVGDRICYMSLCNGVVEDYG